MKHCVEMVPWEISEALARAAVKHDYGNLFLYRVNTVDRLLSLHYAQMSGVWGPDMKREDLADKVFAEPLPIKRLLNHEGLCNQRLNWAWNILKEHGDPAYALSFEDIYTAASAVDAANKLLPLLVHLGLSKGEDEDRRFVAQMIGEGEQGTKTSYSRFEGIDVLNDSLKSIEQFTPSGGLRAVSVEFLGDSDPRFLHLQLDVYPRLAANDVDWQLGGVLVMRDSPPDGSSLSLRNDEGTGEVTWGIESPGMARRFSESPNGSNSRFKLGKASFGAKGFVELEFNDGLGGTWPLFRLRLNR